MIPHARAVVRNRTTLPEVQHFLVPKPVVSGIEEGTIVELIAGPFKGEKAVVKRVDMAKEEITVELYESVVPIPITVRGDNIRIIERAEDAS
jgi:transcriptional antiterminator NusG